MGQYGFRGGHSTSHPVLHLYEKIYISLNQKPSTKTLTIFIDFKKAVDTVDHEMKNWITMVSKIHLTYGLKIIYMTENSFFQ